MAVHSKHSWTFYLKKNKTWKCCFYFDPEYIVFKPAKTARIAEDYLHKEVNINLGVARISLFEILPTVLSCPTHPILPHFTFIYFLWPKNGNKKLGLFHTCLQKWLILIIKIKLSLEGMRRFSEFYFYGRSFSSSLHVINMFIKCSIGKVLSSYIIRKLSSNL